MRVRIGFIQIGEPNGWTIDEFNKGKKAKALPKSPPKGKRPPPKLKSAGGPPKKSPPKKSPKKPKKPSYHSPGNFIRLWIREKDKADMRYEICFS